MLKFITISRCCQCIDIHVELWKDGSIKYLDHINKKIEKYLNKISKLLNNSLLLIDSILKIS